MFKHIKVIKNNLLLEHGYFSAEKFLELVPPHSLVSKRRLFLMTRELGLFILCIYIIPLLDTRRMSYSKTS